ncbi:MAG: acriflavin resistance protein [Candidatus Kaiserbacteria bacterium]|nr:acriflavin resistance protein [Candidatus Kaiserbacteria bacterium]
MLPIWHFFIEKRQFTILVIIGLTIVGGVAAKVTTKESAPEVEIPVGVVSTVLPGASPEEVERLVTNKLETRLANLSNVNKITSTSRESVSVITVEFNASANLEKSIQTLKDEIDKAKTDLPTDAQAPNVTDVNFVDQPIQIISISADRPFSELSTLGETLKNELQGVHGVSRVEVSGAPDREIQIVARKEALAQYGISLSQVVSAISSANTTLPIGSITTDDIVYNIAFDGGLDNVTDLGGLPILNVNGQVIYLRDIATVSDGVQRSTSYTRVSVENAPSQQALTLAIYKVRGYDVTKATVDVRAKLTELQKTILLGSSYLITNDAGDKVQTDLTELTKTGLETIALVMLALFATIGWREAIIAGLSIPLSFLIAFIGILYSGNTINFVSLFALILAIGILVDSGIVIVEAIHTRTREYNDPHKAAYEALREYAWALIGGTMTTVAVFVPLFFISGVVGKFIATIPFTIIFVLLASIFVSLGLVPTLVLLFVRHDGKTSPFMEWQEQMAEKSRVWYAAHLDSFFHHRRTQNIFLTLLGVGFVASICLPIFGAMPVQFFPQADSDFIYVDIEMPYGTTLERTDLAAREIEEKLYTTRGIESFTTTVGQTSAFGNAPAQAARYATVTINLPKKRIVSSTNLVESVRKNTDSIHDAIIRVGEPSGGPPVGAAVLIKFTGDNLETLNSVADKARDVLASTPGATTVDATTKDTGSEFVLTLDRGALASAGISPLIAASTLHTAVAGVTATKFTGGSKDVDVIVSLNLNSQFTDPHDASKTTIDTIRQIPVPAQNGGTVFLGSLLTPSIQRSNAIITHEDRMRVVSVTGDTLPGYTVAQVVAAFQKKYAASNTLPAGVTMTIGGEDEQTNQSFAEMGLALLAGLALMFVILVLAFDSFRYTSYLLLAVPLSLIGVLTGLTLMGQPLSFPSLLGVIALAGVIINHAIILMDSIIVRLNAGGGKTLRAIVVESATSRLRPIFLTTITTVIGMLPLTAASPLWGPLAWAILFGLSFAMILTLILIPLLVYRFPSKLPEGVIRG